jgi:hypothetical protein
VSKDSNLKPSRMTASTPKLKAKMSRYLTKHYAIKAYGGVEVQIHVFLISALVGDEWSASRLCRFNREEKPPGTHWIGGWGVPELVWTIWRSENS